MNGWARWWPVSGLAFVALWVVCGWITDSTPDTGDDDAKIATYFTKNSHQTEGWVGFLVVLAASLLFIWFLAKLRERMLKAEGGTGTLSAMAYGAGIGGVALWLVASGLVAAAAVSADDTTKFVLDPNTYRILNNAAYLIWASGSTIVLITVAATAAIARRSGLLPKWLAWLSFVVAASMLVSIFFIPFLVFLGWVLVVSVTLMVRPGGHPPTRGLA